MSEANYEGIAIIGMTGRFPGAESVEEFWSNLVAGRESISFFTDEELRASGLDPTELRKNGAYVPARGVLREADCFDAGFFGIHPIEAEVMDPQHRVFLEACWTAMERAGYSPQQDRQSVGVFGGATYNTYYEHVLHPRPDLAEKAGHDLVMFGNERDYLTTRVAYKLGLTGPAINVSTACSTSLVAVCQACHSLLTYQCDMALAGGVSVKVPQQSGYRFEEGYIGSPDGHTRTFDTRGAGTVFSNGVAVVVLKRLEEAVRDGDQVYAVIKGAALNNDGSQRVSFGAPGVEGQAQVVAAAHALAGADPRSISYVEAHGTATPLGDPIEVAGLTKAFRYGTEEKQFCALGSVKTNIGHLDAAAGVTGLIKTALALHHKLIPASLHFTEPNPKLDLAESPFYVNATQQHWESEPGVPRRAGVSSFGSGGTNAHVVVEEAPDLPASGSSRSCQLVALSAKTEDALDRATVQLSEHMSRLADWPDASAALREFADAAYTLKLGRSEFVHRRIVTGTDAADVAAALQSLDPKRVFTHKQTLREAPVVFLFPGQGAQYPGMGAALYREEPVFRATVDQCAEILRPILQVDLRTILFPAAGAEDEAQARLTETRYTQPALFVTEYALARLWMSWGIQPHAMLGHSVGEYVAATLAGVFALEEALSLVARRAALVQELPGGAMLAVRLPESELNEFLNGLSIAAINSSSLCVVAGDFDAIGKLEKELGTKRVVTRRLHTSHAFHSQMMDPVLAPFTDLVRRVKLNPPSIPFVSNVTARWITAEQATKPEYWAGHLRECVRFSDGVAELMKDSRNILLEVGPGQTLGTLARQNTSKSAEQIVLSSLPLSGVDELRGFTETVGRLWMSGATVDWSSYYTGENRRRCVLPTYPFERKLYWPETPAQPSTQVIAPVLEAQFSDPANSQIPDVVSMPTVVPAARKDRVLEAVRTLLQEQSGYDLASADRDANLLELGFDSLLLTQAAQLLQRRFKVAVSFRQLMEELGSMESLARYLDEKLPPEAFSPPPPPTPASSATTQAVPAIPFTASPGASSDALLQQLFVQQQQLAAQLAHLIAQRGSTSVPAPTTPRVVPALTASPNSGGHGPFRPMDRAAGLTLNEEQLRFVEALVLRYNRKTAESKRLSGENRSLLADPRSSAGFKQQWKEMVYPIVTAKSDGSRVWDVDGNEYVDFVMGFGASMFGHRPPFVVRAVHEQLDLGFEIGPMTPLAYEVAALMREFTGLERFAFTNTGSEAVLAATRVARTVTGRDKIAVFAGAYHGIFDEVLFRPLVVNGEIRTAPIAPGVAQSAVSQVIVLDFGNPESLEIIRARGDEIAAVLVEPVQSRRLDLQPREFLHQLREVATQIDAALIFDEVVTGFRVDPGGAQAYFGVRADLATYGKVMGGGISVGVVGGDRKYLDALDGGQWQYGDSSFPEVGVTFFAGTFVRHPLALAAAKAVLVHLKEQGPGLQKRLTDRTQRLAADLTAVIDEFGAPYRITQFSSLIQLGIPPEQRFGGLLFYLLRERGIHIFENRAFVVTTAHSEADFDKLLRVFRECLSELRAGGFFEAKPGAIAALPATPTLPTERESLTPAGGDRFTGTFPLTEAQKEIWLASQMSPDAALGYIESLNLEFRGLFDPEIFRAAVGQVVKRHPILTAKISADGQNQSIAGDVTLDVPLEDYSQLAAEQRESQFASVIGKEVSEPFPLETGPLLRVKMVRLASEHHVVLWTSNHIICDGWSAGVLIHELAAIYSGMRRGVPPKLEAPGSFKEYALYAQQDTPDAAKALAYWQDQYKTLPPPLELPTDHPRPAVRSGRAATAVTELDAALLQTLKKTAGQQRTTMVVLLMAGLKTLLYRLTGQTDIVIGLGAAGQAITGANSLVGHCLNLLPIRTHVEPDQSFQANLAAVKSNVLNAFDHSQCTAGALLTHLRFRRTASRPPLVEVIFNVDRDPGAAEFEGTQFSCERNAKRALHYDLFFNFTEGKSGLKLECDYNTDLFEHATMERWLGHIKTMLAGIPKDVEQIPAKLPLLTPLESENLLAQWGRADVNFPPRTLVEWFEKQVEKNPGARAVTYEGRHLTYGELNQSANRLAHYLRTLGAGPDKLIGLYVERSLDIVVGILGILKSGAAYLPIDPVYPKDRIAFMVEDAQAPILLTQSSLVGGLDQFQTKRICLDADPALPQQPDTNPEHVTAPDHLAYVIYTSGSTGKPKGTLVTHRNVTRLMQSTEAWYGFGDRDVWTLFHSHAFDFSVWELWGALLYGGRVVVVPYLTSRSPNEFYALLESEGVTVLNQTPSAFKQLSQVEEGLPVLPKLALRYIIFGGEALELSRLKPWMDRHGDRQPQLVNMYGITETTVHVTYRPLSASDLTRGSVIGAPLPDLQIYILDSYQQPVPVGVAGELYVGGAGVARGYLNRPELNAQRFFPSPFSPQAKGLLYRSGDMARYLPDGDIEYLGRIDNQVKVRGFRIELGEIEEALGGHPGVRNCVVTLQPDPQQEKYLVAYFEPRPGGVPPSVSELRAHLKNNLPDYMVPAAYVALDQLPLTANGKTDRKALPAPDGMRLDTSHEFIPPRDPIEQALAQIWAKILRVKRVGVTDNFFDLGGHSLLAVRVMAEIETLYGKRLPLAALLQAPTVAELAGMLAEEQSPAAWSSLVPIRPSGSRTPLYLIHSHGGNVLEYYPLAARLDQSQPIFALQARGLDGRIPRDQSIEQIAAAYLAEIRTLQPTGPYVLGGYCFGGLVAWEAAQQLTAVGEEIALLVMIQTFNPSIQGAISNNGSPMDWFQKAAKRVALETDYFRLGGISHGVERFRRYRDVYGARVELARHRKQASQRTDYTGSRMPLILEALGIEHDRAFERYVARPYSGKTVLFRASKQVPALRNEKSLGWANLAADLSICEVPGHQQTMLMEPNVTAMAETMNAYLRMLSASDPLQTSSEQDAAVSVVR